MKLLLFLCLTGCLLMAFPSSRAEAAAVWTVRSPDHEQTFAYGTETHRSWGVIGNHLVLFINFTNDPYVDRSNPRQYDSFSFDFPQVRLQPDGRTLSYRTPNGHLVPVARRRAGLLGIEEIMLFNNIDLFVDQPHGYLTLSLRVTDDPSPEKLGASD